eukprot:Em0010g451a
MGARAGVPHEPVSLYPNSPAVVAPASAADHNCVTCVPSQDAGLFLNKAVHTLHKKPGPGRSLSYSIRPYSRSRLHDSHSRFYTTYSRYLSEQSQI